MPLYGFCNLEKSWFLRVELFCKKAKFYAEGIVQGMRYGALRNQQYELYESNIPCDLRGLHVAGMESAGWIRVSSPLHLTWPNKRTVCELELKCRSPKQLTPIKRTGLAPLVVASLIWSA